MMFSVLHYRIDNYNYQRINYVVAYNCDNYNSCNCYYWWIACYFLTRFTNTSRRSCNLHGGAETDLNLIFLCFVKMSGLRINFLGKRCKLTQR